MEISLMDVNHHSLTHCYSLDAFHEQMLLKPQQSHQNESEFTTAYVGKALNSMLFIQPGGEIRHIWQKDPPESPVWIPNAMAPLCCNSITNMGFILDKVYWCLHFHYLAAGPGHLYGDHRKSSVNKFSLRQLIHFFELLNLKVHAVCTFLESTAPYHNVILPINYILY